MKRVSRKIFIIGIIACLLPLFSAGVFAYDENDEWVSLRDGDISLYVPRETDIEEYEDDGGHIATFSLKMDDGNAVQTDLYFTAVQDDSEYVYFNGKKEEGYSYYYHWGEDAIKEVYDESSEDHDFELTKIEKKDFYQGNYVSFVRAEAELENEKTDETRYDAIYITGNTAGGDYIVSRVFIFRNGSSKVSGTYKEIEESMLQDYYDFYDDNFVGADTGSDSTQNDGNDSFNSDSALDVFLDIAPVLVIAAVLFGIWLRRKRYAGEHQHKARETRIDGGTLKRFNPLKKISSESKTEEKLCGDFVPATDAEERYYQSLLTLRKSGLLTRAEMSEMLQKHAEVKEREQR